MAISGAEILAVRLFTACFQCIRQMAPTSMVQEVGSLRILLLLLLLLSEHLYSALSLKISNALMRCVSM